MENDADTPGYLDALVLSDRRLRFRLTSHPTDARKTEPVSVRRGTSTFEVTPEIHEPAMLKSSLLAGNVGYIRLYEFRADPSCESLQAFESLLDGILQDLSKAGAKGWVFDLRGNPGGAIVAAQYVAGRFGFNGLLLTAHDRFGQRLPVESLTSAGEVKGPLDVLVDEQSASASEVIASVFQETRRARVFGTKTPGAVVAASYYPIAGGILQVTEALLEVGPSNHVLDKIGVTPDVVVALDPKLLMDGHDSQLDAALADIQKRVR